MRTFNCRTFEEPAVPLAEAIIIAADENRAIALARRELLDAKRDAWIEVREGGRVVWAAAA